MFGLLVPHSNKPKIGLNKQLKSDKTEMGSDKPKFGSNKLEIG